MSITSFRIAREELEARQKQQAEPAVAVEPATEAIKQVVAEPAPIKEEVAEAPKPVFEKMPTSSKSISSTTVKAKPKTSAQA